MRACVRVGGGGGEGTVKGTGGFTMIKFICGYRQLFNERMIAANTCDVREDINQPFCHIVSTSCSKARRLCQTSACKQLAVSASAEGERNLSHCPSECVTFTYADPKTVYPAIWALGSAGTTEQRCLRVVCFLYRVFILDDTWAKCRTEDEHNEALIRLEHIFA